MTHSNPTTLSVDERIEATAEFLSSPLISQSGRNSIIKSLIRQVSEEVIGEDEPRGKYNADSLLERDVIIRNGIFSEQRTKLNKILGEK